LTPAQVKTRVAGSDALDGIPDEQIAALIAEFEGIAEEYLGAAFRQRTVTGEYITIGPKVALRHYLPTDITITATDPAATLTPTASPSGVIDWGTIAYGTSRPATVDYTHGFTEPPEVVLSACAQYVRAVTARQNGRQVENSISYTTAQGDNFRLSTPDFFAGRPTGFITVDRLLNSTISYRIPGVA